MATLRKPARGTQPAGPHRFFCPCPRGLEGLLAEELTALGGTDVHAADGGAGASGPFELCYAFNLHSRVASRVLWRVGQASYRNENDVYVAVKGLDWPRWFAADRTIRVNVAATHSPLRSLDFITLRVKDAVCDRFRSDTGKRPSVDTTQPDVRIHAYFDAATVTVYLDTSGEALFKRGLRVAGGAAPLRENLAAGILKLCGWTPSVPLLDPMCGSGTFLIEAAEMALRRAPGSRRAFGFERLKVHQPQAWARLRDEARAAEQAPSRLEIHGSDLYGDVLKIARQNLAHAGLEEVVTLKQANVLELSPPAGSGVLVANPPYGVRIGEQEEIAALYPKLGDALKARYAGWRACVFTADLRLPKLIGLKPSRRVPLYNGALECRLYVFEMVAGSARRSAAGQAEGPRP
jgi:putative N6-adenine-specific DNA methylase